MSNDFSINIDWDSREFSVSLDGVELFTARVKDDQDSILDDSFFDKLLGRDPEYNEFDRMMRLWLERNGYDPSP